MQPRASRDLGPCDSDDDDDSVVDKGYDDDITELENDDGDDKDDISEA